MTARFLFAALALLVPAMATQAADFETTAGGTADKLLKPKVTASCDIIVTESCTVRPSHLGSFQLMRSDAEMTTVTSLSRSKCINPVTGVFGEGGAYQATTLRFVANGTYGYDQITARCTRSDGSIMTQSFTISVGK